MRSRFPSPLRSNIWMSAGLESPRRSAKRRGLIRSWRRGKRARPIVHENLDLAVEGRPTPLGDRHIDESVLVQVAQSDVVGIPVDRDKAHRPERAWGIAVCQQDRNGSRTIRIAD